MALDFTTPHRVRVVADFPGYTSQIFKSMDAVAKTATTSRYYDGGATVPDLLTAAPELGSANLSRGWVRSRDVPLIQYLDPLCGQLFFTITKTFLTANSVATANKIIYTVLLTKVTDIAAMTGPGTDPGTLDLAVEVQDRRIA